MNKGIAGIMTFPNLSMSEAKKVERVTKKVTTAERCVLDALPLPYAPSRQMFSS
jgi:hypothetical protein